MTRVPSESEYYTQFASIRGVTIKAPDGVDPAALQEAAKIVAIMIDGRRDIAECIKDDWDSALAVFPKGRPVTDLPEFSYLRGKKDMWGQSYDDPLQIVGLGPTTSNPVTAVTEWGLIPDPGYPRRIYDVAVHEFGHHLMNLCFTHEDHSAIEELHFSTYEMGYGPGLMVNTDEFFAGLSQIYFSIDGSIPRHHLDYFPTEVMDYLQEFYGVLAPAGTEDSGYVRYVTSSGIPLPWVTTAGGTFVHGTFGYSIELSPDWKVEDEGLYETLLRGRSSEVRIRYSNLDRGVDTESEFLHLAETQRQRWEQWTRGWDESEVKSFERESVDGQDSYWIRYYGHESPNYCSIDVIERVLITSHDGRNYGVVLEGHICGAGVPASIQDMEGMLRSFNP